jgi:hypothetical protein
MSTDFGTIVPLGARSSGNTPMDPLEKFPQVDNHHTKMLLRRLLRFNTYPELTSSPLEEAIDDISDLPS